MMLSIFSVLYELVIGKSDFSSEYRQKIFTPVGLLTFITAVCICFAFYVLLGRWKGIWFTKTHWVITIVLCAIVGYLIAFFETRNVLGDVEDGGYSFLFALFNALYSALYFILFSFVFKRLSIFSKRTPF